MKLMTGHLARRLLTAGLALGSAIAVAATADVQYPAGNQLGLVPPPGMQLDPRGAAFRDPANNASLMVMELPPGAYEAVRGQMITADAKKHGILIDRRETLFTNAGAMLLSAGEDTVHHERKWMALGLMPGMTALVTVQIPDGAKSLYPDAAVHAALTTLTRRDVPLKEELALLPFKLTDLADFHIVAASHNAVILTKGAGSVADAGQPHVVVGVGNGGRAPTSEWPRLAQLLLERVPGYVDRQITDSEMIRIDGAPAYEIRANARAAMSGAAVAMVQWVRFGTGSYMQIVGVTPKADWSRDFPQFRAIRDGIKPRS